jgi:predicted HTH transcriptional regulator
LIGIGDSLKELHLTEGRNTGFKKMLDALETNGSPKLELSKYMTSNIASAPCFQGAEFFDFPVIFNP